MPSDFIEKVFVESSEIYNYCIEHQDQRYYDCQPVPLADKTINPGSEHYD